MADDDLLKQLDVPQAEAWRPEPGEHLLGFVVSLTWRPASEYDAYPILTVRLDDGTEKAVHAFHKVLRDQLLEKRPQTGERIAIKYHGRVAGATNEYANYTVAISKPEGSALDWQEPGTVEQESPPPPMPARDGDDIPF